MRPATRSPRCSRASAQASRKLNPIQTGVPKQDGLYLEPQDYATREQMAVMLAQFCRELNVWNKPIPEL